MSDPYIYERLDSERQQIRLLEILPDEAEQPVRVKIRTVEFPAFYETISYAWGDPTRSACVEIRSRTLQTWRRQLRVPSNTEAALRRVRRQDRVRAVWIDAVCINQDDKVERSQQVAIMGMIFASSVGNLVYLGELEDANMAARIKRTLDDLLAHARSETDDLQTFESALSDPAQEAQWQRQGLPFKVDEDVLRLVLKLPWFRRLWVLQEAVMAPNSTALLGPLQLDLYDMLRAIIWWQRHIKSYPSGTTQGFQCLISTYFALHQRGDSRAPSAQSLSNLLITAQDFQKSDSRDGVYALLAMMDERSSSALSPDYTRPLSEILQSASRLAIEKDPSILSNIAHRPGDLERAEVASWAVRVDRETDGEIDPFTLPWRKGLTYMVSERRDDSPSGGWESRVLGLKGHQADTVNMVTPSCTPLLYDDDEALSMWLWRVMELHSNVSCAHEARFDAIARILCADGYHSRQYHQLEDEERNRVKSCLAALGPAMTENPLKLFEAVKTLTPGFWNSIFHRQCFVTQQGRLGLGPRDMQAGDIVAALSDAEYPSILRPLDGEQYQFVGAAYVDRLMPGELDHEWEVEEAKVFALV
ncbi:Folylpolyglutamate synthetase [Elasticomyces elasticus]|nr:Folylpolyglutamate synthetase [Elasticomyces elasticus]KAK4970376.1 hypothetical protein LTR42_008543 [Elasticomyces elasticus]